MTETGIIVTAIFGFLSTCFTGVMAFLLARMNASQSKAAIKVEEVKEKAVIAATKVEEVKASLKVSNQETSAKLQEIAVVGVATHTLVNSNMGIQLKINVVALKRIAEYSNLPEDYEAAQMAENLYQEHLSKQAIVDDAKAKKG